MKYLFLAVLLCGCTLTQSERQSIIDQASQTAALAASQKAYDAVYAESIKQGKSIEEAKAVASTASDVAGKAAAALAATIAEKSTEGAVDAKGSKVGSALAAIGITILTILGAIIKKGASAAV